MFRVLTTVSILSLLAIAPAAAQTISLACTREGYPAYHITFDLGAHTVTYSNGLSLPVQITDTDVTWREVNVVGATTYVDYNRDTAQITETVHAGGNGQGVTWGDWSTVSNCVPGQKIF